MKGIHIRTNPILDLWIVSHNQMKEIETPLSKLISQKWRHRVFFNGDGSLIELYPKGQTIPAEWVLLFLTIGLKTGERNGKFILRALLQMSQVLLRKHNLEVMPLHLLKEENRSLEKAIIWDRKGLRFGSLIPDWDGIFQAMLLLKALCKHDLNWQHFAQRMESLTENRVQEQRSLSINAQQWEEKQINLLEKMEEISTVKLNKVTEEEKI